MKTIQLKTTATIILIMALVSNCFSQDKELQSVWHYDVGAAAGLTTGYGLSARVFKNNFGVQLTGIPYSDSQSSTNNIGVTFEYYVVKKEKSSMFLYQSNSFYNRINKNPYSFESKYEESNSHGIGFGIERNLNSILSNIMIGYGSVYNEYTGLIVEGGLYYRIK